MKLFHTTSFFQCYKLHKVKNKKKKTWGKKNELSTDDLQFGKNRFFWTARAHTKNIKYREKNRINKKDGIHTISSFQY